MNFLIDPIVELLSILKRWGIWTVVEFGRWCEFSGLAFVSIFKRPSRFRQIIDQMQFVGVKSTTIIALTAFFTGAVFALQTGKIFSLFNMETMVGASSALSLTREIGPVFACLMITARACSAMAAEIGTMRVTEQIDALECMAVEPVHYLVMPRVLATTVMAPVLTIFFNYIGVFGSYIVGIYLLNIYEGPFLTRLYYYVDPDDIYGGIIKAAFFGFLVSAISCYQGYCTKGGAKGVGRSTTRAVVISAVTILVVDYFLTTWILELLSK